MLTEVCAFVWLMESGSSQGMHEYAPMGHKNMIMQYCHSEAEDSLTHSFESQVFYYKRNGI